MASALSPRQREILDLVASGHTSKEIASALGISESTVNWHLANVFAKLGVSSRAEAVARAYVANGQEGPYAPSLDRPVPTPQAWPRFIAIAIAIAIAAALLGGVTVATFRVGPIPIPTPSPANGSDRAPTSSPSSGVREDVTGSELVPAGAAHDALVDPTPNGLPPVFPPTPLPSPSALPLQSVPIPLPTPALPSLPIASPPLATSPTLPTVPTLTSLPLPTPALPDLALPTPIPSPQLPLP